MSAELFCRFLPWTGNFLRTSERTRLVWDLVFPEDVKQLCPVPLWSIPLGLGNGVIEMRWGVSAFFILAGIFGGFAAGSRLLLREARSSQPISGLFMWGWACVWYGFMCVGALMSHCFLPENQFFYLVDVVSTGCSGMSAVGGFLTVGRIIDDRQFVWRIAAFSTYLSLAILAFIGTPLIRDQIYILPTIATVVCLSCRKILLDRGDPSESAAAREAGQWLGLGVLGSVVSIGSVLGDRWLCHTFGAQGGFLIWVFLGSDLALLGAYKFIDVLSSLPPRPPGGRLRSKSKSP